jgi:uncharacterized protein YjbI with pentapeptide repeats
LTGAALGNGDFTRCDFTDARIDQISIGNALVTFRQVASTHDFKQRRSLRVAISGRWPGFGADGEWNFSGIDLRGSTFHFPDRMDIDVTDANIGRCTIMGGLTSARLRTTKNYKAGNLVGINFRVIDLSDCDLSGMNLTESRFAQCKFDNANLEDAVITGADFGPQWRIEKTRNRVTQLFIPEHTVAKLIVTPITAVLVAAS